MAEYIRLDLFPARVHTDTDVLAQARVIVTNDEAYFYVDDGSSPDGVGIRYSGGLDDFTGDNQVGYVIKLDDGMVLNVQRTGGCGCGSRLRGFHPFSGVPHIARF